MPLIATKRGAIYYADHRRAELNTPPMLLIHGAGGTHLDWSIDLRKLNAVVPDLPGHGKSPGVGRITIDDYTADVVALMDALELDTAVVGGHSMGGAIALTSALDYPTRVRGLLLIGTGAKLSVHADILDRVRDHQTEVGMLFKTWMWGATAETRLREAGYQQFLKVDPNIIYGDYLACNAFDVRTRLGEITVPTLVIGGTEDRMTPFTYSQYLAQQIENAQLVTITGGGHMMGLERTQVVATAVQTWLMSAIL